jgi:hypothetical protein
MDDPENAGRSLRERIGGNAEERLGKALSELLESPLFTGAIGRAFDAREKAAQAQEVALGALNLPSAADIERLTRRLRSVTHRLEGIEEGVDRLDNSLSGRSVEARLGAIEERLQNLVDKLDRSVGALGGQAASARQAHDPGEATAAGKAKAVAKARAAAKQAPVAKAGAAGGSRRSSKA